MPRSVKIFAKIKAQIRPDLRLLLLDRRYYIKFSKLKSRNFLKPIYVKCLLHRAFKSAIIIISTCSLLALHAVRFFASTVTRMLFQLGE